MLPYRLSAIIAVFAAFLLTAAAQESKSFRFAVIGDRTGEAQQGVYEEVWKELAAENPAFVLSAGDTIEGTSDATVDGQWQEIERFLSSWKRFPLYLAAGNHDIWSTTSERVFTKYSGHAPHYSFDYAQVHFSVLDNSRSDELSAAELSFLDADLRQNQNQTLKFIVSHRPSWIVKAMLDDPDFELHRIAKKYGVRFVIAGHVHEMLNMSLDGVSYISMPSAGGHLRGAGKYEDGWFFGYAVVDVIDGRASIHVQELNEPYGKGRRSTLNDWGRAGIVSR
jgi:predicted phosphodiesterase